MAEKVKVWFAPEGDFLEVQFKDAPGFMRPTAHEAVMEQVDEAGTGAGIQHSGRESCSKRPPLGS